MLSMKNFSTNICRIAIMSLILLFISSASHSFEAGWYSQIANSASLSEYASYGTKIMLPYNGAYLPKSIGPYLYEAQKNNIKVWVDLRLEALTLSEANFRAIIRTHKNHPALHGWYISDEPELDKTTPDKLKMYYSICKQEDPYHPVAIAHAHKGYINFVGNYDYLFIDYYPGWTLYNANEFNWMVRKSYSIWKEGLEFSKKHEKQGFVAVGLGFGANEDGTPRNGVRDLSYAEYRYHAFSAIVQGVDGFLFWADDWASTHIKKMVSTMISQINSISEEMKFGKTNDIQIKNSHPSKIIYRYGVSGGNHILLTVNISGHDVSDNGEALKNVRFDLPEKIEASHVIVLDENRIIPVINNTFSDNYKRFEVHTYKVVKSSEKNSSEIGQPQNLSIR